jgi:hypothetical protein
VTNGLGERAELEAATVEGFELDRGVLSAMAAQANG